MKTTLTPSSSLRWAQERSFVLLVDEQTGKSQSLRGYEAAVWNWFQLGYTRERIVRLLASLLEISSWDAKTKLNSILTQWQKQGWLEGRHG